MILLSFVSWWEALSTIAMIYWIIAIPVSIVFLYQMAVIFFNAESKTEYISNQSALNGEEKTIVFKLFTFENLIGFFTAFGWSGLAFIDIGLSNLSIVIFSAICGCILALTMAIVFYFIKKLMVSVKEGLD